MRILKTLFAASVCLAIVAASVPPVPAASPNAASHVTATLVTDPDSGLTSLVITGDHKNNTITVSVADGILSVSGEKKTFVNKRKVPATFDATEVDSLVISMGNGDDTVVLDMDISAGATLDADGGAGADSLTVTGVIDAAATITVENWETLDPPDLGL